MTINANVGRAGPDLSVQADHYDQKVVENAGLKRDVEDLQRALARTRSQLRDVTRNADQRGQDAQRLADQLEQGARRHSEQLDNLNRVHEEAKARLTKRAEAAERAVAELRAQALRQTSRSVTLAREVIGSMATGSSATSRTLLTVVGAAAMVGVVVGGIGMGMLRGDEPASSAVSRDSSPPAETRGSLVAPAADPVALVDLPCQTGSFVVRLASFAPNVPSTVGLTLEQLVQARRDELLHRASTFGVPLTVQATGPGHEVCPGLPRGDELPDERTYVFSGPMPQAEASRVCQRLRYGLNDCLVAELTP